MRALRQYATEKQDFPKNFSRLNKDRSNIRGASLQQFFIPGSLPKVAVRVCEEAGVSCRIGLFFCVEIVRF